MRLRTPLAWKNLTHDLRRLFVAVSGVAFAVILIFMELGFLNALHAALAEPFVLGDHTNLLDVRVDISGNELAVATHTALEIDTMVIVPDATDALANVLALLSEALMLTTGGFECLRGVLQAHRGFGGPARPALFGLVTRVWLVGVHLLELVPGCAERLVCSPLFHGHGT